MILALADTYLKILGLIMDILLPIIIFVSIITLIKIIIDYKKYGKEAFSVFRKRGQIDISKENLNMLIQNLKTYYKIIELNNIVILILESGIYVIYLLDYDGIISGDISKETLVFKENTTDERKIENPIYVINNKIKELKNLFDEDVFGYILLKGNCVFGALNRSDIKIISYNSFYYHFSKFTDNKKLSIEKINQIYEKIVS